MESLGAPQRAETSDTRTRAEEKKAQANTLEELNSILEEQTKNIGMPQKSKNKTDEQKQNL